MNSPGLIVVEWGQSTPVAHVSERLGRVVWASRAQPTPVQLLRFVMPALAAPRETLRRTPKADGSVVLRIKQLEANQRAYWEVIASTMNFAPHSTGHYQARVVDLLPNDVAFRELPAPVVWMDMLAFPGVPFPPIHCPCGTAYAYGTDKCPGCLGDDPIVHLFRRNGEAVEGAIRFGLSSLGANALYEQALSARAPLAASASRDRALPEPRPEDGPNDQLRRLDRYFRGRLALPRGDRGSLQRLQSELQQSPRKITASAAAAALETRRMWRPDAEYGWLGTRASMPTVSREVAETWAPVAGELSAVARKLTVAVARFAPVHQILSKDQSLTWGKAARWALAAVSAAKTMGASLVLKGVMAAVRDEKQRNVIAAFETALIEADAAIERAEAILLRSAKAQEQHDARMRTTAQGYMGALLGWDYASASADEQLAMVERLALRAGVSLNPKKLRKRGPRQRSIWRAVLQPLLVLRPARSDARVLIALLVAGVLVATLLWIALS